MEKDNRMKSVSTKKAVIILLIVVLVTVLLAGIVVYFVLTSDSRKLAKQLSLANEYMDDGDYDKAIAAFGEALAIDPMSVDAYLGEADAYEALAKQVDDTAAIEYYEKAIDVLQTGYDKTKDEALKMRIDELKELVEEIELKKAEENARKVRETEEDTELETGARTPSFSWDDFTYEGMSPDRDSISVLIEKHDIKMKYSPDYASPDLEYVTNSIEPIEHWFVTLDPYPSESGNPSCMLFLNDSEGYMELFCEKGINEEQLARYSSPITLGMGESEVFDMVGLSSDEIDLIVSKAKSITKETSTLGVVQIYLVKSYSDGGESLYVREQNRFLIVDLDNSNTVIRWRVGYYYNQVD